ncbi:MAG: sodium:solute symporter [Planctomycetota bacterium]|nr:sodium:solute symporter [Planctomycetota bacterium]
MTFRPLDIIAIVAYLAAVAGMGVYFARKNKSTEEYFVGNRSFPGWVVGLSMLGTTISSVTFLAFPAAAFKLDWRLIVPNLFVPAVAVLAIVVFIPFFRRGRLTSAFEYLGDRYGPVTRLYGTFSFIFLQLLRLGKILFLVAIPINILTGVPMTTVIVAAGIFIAFYTVAGGIEAVIWTDVIQAIVLIVGGVVCFIYIVMSLPGGLPQIFEIASADGKFHVGSMDWDLGKRTFWTVAMLGIFNWIVIYSSDQNIIQRYAAAASTREARKATAVYSLVAVPTWVFFFFLGTCVFVFYRVFPDPRIATLEADQVFPYFILTKIPAGIAGITIAGVLAAAMSSLDSSINAISTVTVVDILKPYICPGRDDRFYLRFARVLATCTAGMMIGGAVFFQHVPKESMADLSLIVASVFGGCMVGLFMMGFFTTRVDNRSALIALGLAIGLNVYFVLNTLGWLPETMRIDVHAYWVGMIVNGFFVTTAYGISLISKGSRENLDGLTIWTLSVKGETK